MIDPLNTKDPKKNPSPFIFDFHPLHKLLQDDKKELNERIVSSKGKKNRGLKRKQ